jgi:uncharacterized protein YbjT (DUF2867 family)
VPKTEQAKSVRVLLAGGTGLVGGLLADQLRRRSNVALESLVRSSCRPDERAVDFNALAADPTLGGADTSVDVGVCCLGTTMRKAGSPAAFRRVDYDYVVAFARAARARGTGHFILVSSVDAGGSSFYLRVKGETEAAVAALEFRRLDILRPSLLLGPREERRPAERIAQAAAPLFNLLLPASLARYRAVDASIVARAIERLLACENQGVHFHYVPDLVELGGSEARPHVSAG